MTVGPNSSHSSSTGTVHRLPIPEPASHESLIDRLLKLLKLQIELGLAEVQQIAKSALVAVVVALVAGMALIAAVVVLITGGVAAIADGVWAPFVIAGGGVTLISLAALGWSVCRLRNLKWPRETVTSLQTNSRWLGAKLKSTLTMPASAVHAFPSPEGESRKWEHAMTQRSDPKPSDTGKIRTRR